MVAEALQHRLGRVPIAILTPDTYHRYRGAECGQPGLSRAPAGAVVADLEYLDGCDNIHQQRFGCPPHVTGEQDIERTVRQPQHHGVLVLIELSRGPLTSRMENREPDRIHREDIAAARGAPLCTHGLDSAQKLEIQAGLQRLPRLDHQRGPHRLHDGGHTAEVVGIAVGDHDDIETAYAPPSQER